MTGGIRQDKPQIELDMGNLIKGNNYQEVDGEFSGYKSLEGYEVFDGTQLASEEALEYVEGVPDDTNREAVRDAITAVGDTDGSGIVTGIFDYEEGSCVYACRPDGTNTYDKMWKSTGTGWTEIPVTTSLVYTTGTKGAGTPFAVGETITGSVSTKTFVITGISIESGSWTSGTATGIITYASLSGALDPTDVFSNTSGATAAYDETADDLVLGKSGSYKFIDGRFDLLSGLQRKSTVFMVSDKFYPSYLRNDVITPILHEDLPDNSTTGFFATSIVEFKNRLWLGYPDGRLIFSNVGNPVDFDSTTFSGTIYLEDEIVDLAVTLGDALIVFCKNSIQVIKALSTSDLSNQTIVDYLFTNVSLTTEIGAVKNTSAMILDDIMYIDERGLASISSTQNYGDFEFKSYSKGVNKTLLKYFSNIVGVAVNKNNNQYRLFFDNGKGIIFTFYLRTIGSNLTKAIKGATTFTYLTSVSCVSGSYFGSEDGYVYKIDSGTSFNGEPIATTLESIYHHYNAPTFIKRFREVFFEGYIPSNITFDIRASFDYRATDFVPSTDLSDLIMQGVTGGIYGEGIYGTVTYGGSENQTSTFYVDGYGTTMNILLYSSSKYATPHVISNMITQYSINGRRM